MSEDYYLNKKEQRELDFVVDTFEFCGCSSPDITHDIMRVLKELNNDGTSNYISNLTETLDLEYKYIELILMCLYREGLIEHGSTLRGSWITPEGKEILKEWDEIQNDG